MMYEVEFDYLLPEGGVLMVDLDEDLDETEREAEAYSAIKEVYDDVRDVTILNMRKIS